MHKLNNRETIGNSFYAKPGDSHSKRLEYVYNHIHGVLPTMLSFSDEFEMTCLAPIEENFELFCSTLNKVGDRLLEEGVWIGKDGTIYEGIFLNIAYKNQDGQRLFYDNTIIMHGGPVLTDKEKALQDLTVGVRVACRDKEHTKVIIDMLEAHKLKDKAKIYMLANSYGDLSFTALPMPEVSMNLELNYGESFPELHEKIVNSLNKDKSGLYLFHGPPGTGKSSYVKHLLSGEVKRKIAYIPVGMINQLVSPDMIPLLMDNKDIILVIEDAEKALISRESSENSDVVSTILNLTDGFIGNALNISVVATFNVEKEKLDAALLRKGRLRHSYEFKKLTVQQAKRLAKSIGADSSKVTEDSTLADIYNMEVDTGYTAPVVRRVGFGG